MNQSKKRECAEPGCDRPHWGLGLCAAHLKRHRTNSAKTGPISTAEALTDDEYEPCPAGLLDLAHACADNDARAIVRLLWPHLLEASFAGVEPFTLEAS